MYNLTHNEDSSVDIGGVWTGPDQFELHFRLNQDDEEDIEIFLILTHGELQGFVRYLDHKLSANFLRNM